MLVVEKACDVDAINIANQQASLSNVTPPANDMSTPRMRAER
jgi:hypothetical protein